MNANMSKWKAPFIYLGSASPRRRELLTQFGVPFEVVKSSYEETHEAWTDPVQYVMTQAQGKARNAILPVVTHENTRVVNESHNKAENEEGNHRVSETDKHGAGYETINDVTTSAIVLGADTIVVFNHQLLGKPADESQAKQMLNALSGTRHQVMTGICLRYLNEQYETIKEKTFCVSTDVEFYELSDDEIEAYVATGEPMDKAGAYGIQGLGGYLVKSIHGSYTNVVGLPVEVVLRELRT